MNEITGSFDSLLRQAWETAGDYLEHGIRQIDGALGKGYAKDHPELIAAFMQTAAIDFASATIAKTLASALEEIATALTGDR